MANKDADASEVTSRRSVLGGAAGAVAALTSGCVQRARSLINRQSTRPISLTIKTVPADEDHAATEIARLLAASLDAVGIEAEVVLLAESELRRDILINHAYDIYVARYPGHSDPDFLRPLLHSRYNGEPGWQNPFGFTDLTVDDLLNAQRHHEGADRRSLLADLQREIARQQPFAIVGFPDDIRAVRTDRFDGWTVYPLRDPLSYLSIRRRDTDSNTSGQPTGERDPPRLSVTITDSRVTKNFNPIAVEFRNQGTFVGLLYDTLARRFDGAVRPWLAQSWSWNTDENATTATVRLREGLQWHDENPLTASDVAFTYHFLADTTLGERDTPVPAPRFRGRTSLVEAVEEFDDRTLRFEFGETKPEAAIRAFTVPILPIHEWEPKGQEVEVAGLELFEGVTEALVWENPRPVGSGVLRFDRRIPEEMLILHRFDDHFVFREQPDGFERPGDRDLAFVELAARVAPSDAAAIDLIAAGEADATATSVSPSVVPRIGRSDVLELLVDQSRGFYHVGFNTRRAPLSNQRFRRANARLLDKQTIADDVFEGYLRPSTVPLAGEDWTPSDLRWEGSDPEVPFAGTEGELNVTAARDLFREAGYRYNDDGQLSSR